MAGFSLLHLDDKSEYLSEFGSFISNKASDIFDVKGFVYVEPALRYLEEHQDTHLCLVDYALDREQYPGSDEFWNGLSFAMAAKHISPNTNFILLTTSRTATLMKKAAEAGYFGIIKKSDLKQPNPQPLISYLKYACHYSESFLRRRSDARLNFSQSIAHTLHSTLSTNNSIIAEAQSLLESELTDMDAIKEKMNLLANRHSETIEKTKRVLNLYAKLQIAPENTSLSVTLSDLIARHSRRDALVFIKPPEDLVGRFDPVLVGLAVENLIDNSLKATSNQQGPPRSIEISAKLVDDEGDSFFEVCVTDNGVGLKPGTENDINRPLFTADNLKKGIASFGIGCAEAEKIMMLHRDGTMMGSLTVKNRPGGTGCVATLRFPKDAQ